MTLSDAQVRRNALVLTGAQALGGANPAIVISLGGLVGTTLAPDPAMATLPIGLFNLGLAAGTLPAAMLMRRYGRRAGYVLGALLGALAGVVAAYGVYAGAFVLFCAGTMISGLYASYVQSYRFAAADGAAADLRPRVISWVMMGGLAAAVIGPQTVIWTRDLIPAAPFSASFVAQAMLALLALPVIALLRAPAPAPAESDGSAPGARPLGEIARSPRFVAAVAAGMVTYGLMSFVMTAAPVAMVACGHTVGEAALGIQWHVLAMFGPSFYTGRLIQRYGKIRVTAAGLLLTSAAAIVALSGLGLAHFWIALVLLGLGWNLGFIGATALVTDCYAPSERARVQGLNDFLVFGSVAVASFSSGQLLSAGGWEMVNMIVHPAVAAVLLLLAWQHFRTAEPAPR